MKAKKSGEAEVTKESILEWLKRTYKLILLSINACLKDNVTILASGLVYSTLVSIVPFVAFMMAFFSIFGITEQFFSVLLNLLSDILGSSISDPLIGLLKQYSTNAMGLGVFGLISFIVTAIFLVNKIYSVVNQMFHTQPSNGTIRRFSNFFLFLIIGVFLISVILSFNSSINNKISTVLGQNKLSPWRTFFTSIIPQFALIWCLLFIFYKYVPNAKVKTKNAIFGANVGIIALGIANYIFKKVVTVTVSYSVIYGSLASILFVLLFVYIFWYIVLVCAKIVYVKQFKPDLSQVQGQPELPVNQISQAINMLMIICKAYKDGEGAVSDKVIVRKLAIPPSLVYSYLQALDKNGIILTVTTKGIAYVPAKPLDAIYVKDVVAVLYGEVNQKSASTIGEAVSEQLAVAGLDAMGTLTIENLLERV